MFCFVLFQLTEKSFGDEPVRDYGNISMMKPQKKCIWGIRGLAVCSAGHTGW